MCFPLGRARGPLLLTALFAALACDGAADEQPAPRSDSALTGAVAEPPGATAEVLPVTRVVRAPAVGRIPDSPAGARIRRGQAILASTRDSLPGHVGNSLRCTSCHLENGMRIDALPWLGVTARYPQYRARAGREVSIEERVNGCLERSMNGRRLPTDGPEMAAIVAYFAHLSEGVPGGAAVMGQGSPPIPRLPADTAHGGEVYAAACARCHGATGGGTPLAPPVGGDASYNIGAGMARVYTAAAFIRANMPFDAPGSLSAQDAIDVAAYINSFARPDFAAGMNDWPLGGAPADVPYPISSTRRP